MALIKDNTVISTPISFFYMNATGNVSFVCCRSIFRERQQFFCSTKLIRLKWCYYTLSSRFPIRPPQYWSFTEQSLIKRLLASTQTLQSVSKGLNLYEQVEYNLGVAPFHLMQQVSSSQIVYELKSSHDWSKSTTKNKGGKIFKKWLMT